MIQTYSTDNLFKIVWYIFAGNQKKFDGIKIRNWVIERLSDCSPMTTAYCVHGCVHCNKIQVSIYNAPFMSKMITLPEEYPKHTLSPEIDDEMKSR